MKAQVTPNIKQAKTRLLLGVQRFQFGADLRPGMVLGDCVLERELDHGQCGVLWLAQQRGLNRKVTVKVLRRDLVAQSAHIEFQQRAEDLAQLEHDSLAQVYAAGRSGHVQYLVQEHVPGITMNQLIQSLGSFRNTPGESLLPRIKNSLRRSVGLGLTTERWVFKDDRNSVSLAIRHISEIAEGLEYSHRKNIHHGSVCDHSIMITESGCARLVNFSVKRGMTARREKMMRGYIPPEQAKFGEGSPSSDVYSLGVVLHKAITGKYPCSPSGGVFSRQKSIRRMRELSPEISRHLARMVARAIHPEVRLRYATAGDFAKDLRQYLHAYSKQCPFYSLWVCGLWKLRENFRRWFRRSQHAMLFAD